jgi:intracellular proteinase inhibitor BsuPI/S-layer family protein
MARYLRSGFAVALAVSAAVMTAAPGAAGTFPDIQATPYAQAIEKLAVAGVLPGFPDGTFKPDQPVTRLTAVAALAKGLDVQGAGTLPAYKDLAEIPEDVRPVIAALLNTGAASQQKAEVTKNDLVYTLSTDKAVYAIDDPVDLTFTITNVGKEDTKLEFSTTQQYDFIIKQGTGEIARWSLGQTFVQSPPTQPLTLFLAPGKAFVYTTRWLQKDQDNQLVPPGTYEIVAVSTAKGNPVSVTLEFQKGLLTTFPDNTFRPNAQVTRAEFAALIIRAMGRQGEATQKAQAPLSVSDAADVAAPLHGYVAVAIDQKILPPYPDGTFRPNVPTTRAEAAGALAAVMDTLGKFNYVKGSLVSIGNGQVTVSGASQAVTSYALAPTLAVYRNGRPAVTEDLKASDQVLLLLTGPRGRAGYIEAKGP